MFEEVALRDVAEDRGLIGGPFGSSLTGKDYTDNGVPVIRGGNMGPGNWVGGEFAFVSPEKFESELSRNSALLGDLVFTQRGTLGQVAIVPDSPYPFYVVSQSQMRLRVDASRYDRRFVLYACSTARFEQQVHDNAIATGVPHINLGILGRLKIPSPPLSEQRAIAEVLGALDDKIAANASLVRTLDDLLAAKFVQASERVQWGVLSDIAEVNGDSVRPKAEGSLRYIDISSVSEGSFEFPPPTPWSEAPGRARRRVQLGDTLWSTVRPNRRSHALVLDRAPELIASTGLAVITPKAGAFALVYEATRTPEFTSYLVSVAEGSAYPAVRAERFLEAPVPALSASTIAEFDRFAQPMRWRAHAASTESRRLAAMRDAILPALLSGRIRVRGAAQMIEGTE